MAHLPPPHQDMFLVRPPVRLLSSVTLEVVLPALALCSSRSTPWSISIRATCHATEVPLVLSARIPRNGGGGGFGARHPLCYSLSSPLLPSPPPPPPPPTLPELANGAVLDLAAAGKGAGGDVSCRGKVMRLVGDRDAGHRGGAMRLDGSGQGRRQWDCSLTATSPPCSSSAPPVLRQTSMGLHQRRPTREMGKRRGHFRNSAL
ncbi:hypothetical protein BS78_04G212600 [Paspalum vaginatum]|nr:hypothetical protein BS78_04G212600 [Paspalum vaginatum]